MKLHLPKALLSLLILATTAISGYAENIEVGRVTKEYSGTNGDTSTLPSQSGVYDYTAKTGKQDLTLTGNDKVGTFDENGNLITTFSKYQADDDFNLFGENKVTHTWSGNGVITQNFKVDGTLAITGTSQVVLGGQYKVNDEDLDWPSIVAPDYDEYTGVIANKVVVTDQGYLQSYNAQVGTLDAQGGTVKLHTGMYQGNTGMRLEGAKDSKQVQIHHALKVSGTANVTIGTTTKDGSAQDEHIATAFGSFTYVGNPELSEGEDEETDVDNYVTNVEDYNIHSSQITQEGGTLNVYGKSLSIGGLNIEQSGGTMAISTGQNQKTENNQVTAEAPMCHFLADYGDSTITQSGAKGTTLSIGLIKAYNSQYDSVIKSLQINGKPVPDINPSLTVSQTGTGTINLNGVYFFNQKTNAASTEKSTITQSGGGIINLNGAYEGATFDITQEENGGTINLNGNMTAGQVSQSAGTLNIGKDVTLTADSVSVGSDMVVNGSLTAATEDSLLSIVGQGHLENSGSIGMDILLEGGELTAVDGSTFTNVVATSGTIYLGDAVSFDSLTLGSNAEIALYTLRNAQNGVTVYVGKGGAVADNVTIGNNVTFVVETEGTAEDLVGQNLTIFQKQDGTTYDLDEAKLIVKDSTGTETELSFSSNGDGTVNITGNIPEPTTATLSLLALAALAARRRRAA
ncbi:MAG: hypothetical protein E7033_07260 [Akkermansiaceae bacterium]|nr:hypothetical protein [Akkermansiaceae bacterium]